MKLGEEELMAWIPDCCEGEERWSYEGDSLSMHEAYKSIYLPRFIIR